MASWRSASVAPSYPRSRKTRTAASSALSRSNPRGRPRARGGAVFIMFTTKRRSDGTQERHRPSSARLDTRPGGPRQARPARKLARPTAPRRANRHPLCRFITAENTAKSRDRARLAKKIAGPCRSGPFPFVAIVKAVVEPPHNKENRNGREHRQASPRTSCTPRADLSSLPRWRCHGEVAAAARLHGQGPPHQARGRWDLQNVLHQPHDGPLPFVR